MKYAVRYDSRGGNTKAVADVIAKKLGVKALRTFEPLDEEVDVLFVGGGVWFNAPSKALKEFLADLEASKVKEIVAFGTAEFSAATIKKIGLVARAKGIKFNEHSLLLKLGYQGFSLFAPAGGDLKADQIKKVEEFTDVIIKK
ncbi:flavodoxin family protein [Lactococcus kimchii]|uniref:flavodoxin family protein n=1 Tax=Lactococcus sp. S-13 TaxID=2507158 RepID=UPI001022FA99|nr:flavodoxin family protein [Lactococcus sp. S-13]RZI48472.1 hypothetical protein EQJ87_02835 [Lactococcus sp. S-13]